MSRSIIIKQWACSEHAKKKTYAQYTIKSPLTRYLWKGREIKLGEKQVEKDLYHIPTRNEKTGKIKVNTTLKKGEYFPVINEIEPQQDFVKYKKPELQDTPIDKQIEIDLEKLLEANKVSFAEDERQIGTTPLIKMLIDTGVNPPIARKSYTLAIKHHEWLKKEIDKLLEAGVNPL